MTVRGGNHRSWRPHWALTRWRCAHTASLLSRSNAVN